MFKEGKTTTGGKLDNGTGSKKASDRHNDVIIDIVGKMTFENSNPLALWTDYNCFPGGIKATHCQACHDVIIENVRKMSFETRKALNQS